MGLFDRVNRVWSGLDFWDKDENRRQQQQALLRNTRSEQALKLDKQAETRDRNRDRNRRGAGTRTNNLVEKRRPTPPSQSNFNRVRDLFDANTEADKYRRTQAGLPADFTAEQQILRRNNVQSTATNPFKRIYDEATEASRRIGTGLFRGTGEQQKINQALLNEQQTINDSVLKAQRKLQDPNVSAEEKQRWYNYLVKEYPNIQKRNREISQTLERYTADADPVAGAAAIAEMGLDVATLGAGGAVLKGSKAAAKQGTKQLTRYLGKNVFKPVGLGAAEGAVGSVTGLGGESTPGSIAAGAAVGGSLTLAFPALGSVLGKLSQKGADPDKAITKIVNATTKEEISDVVEKELEIKISPEATEALATTSDKNLTSAILDSEIATTSKTEGLVPAVSNTLEEPLPRTSTEITESVSTAAQLAKERYPKKTIRQKISQQWDKRIEAVKLDRAFAKFKGIKKSKIDADESIDALIEASEQSSKISAEYLRSSPAAKTIQKYGVGGQEEVEFNTYRLFMRDMEQRAAGRQSLFRDVSDIELKNYIEEYEAKNPSARDDLLALVETVESAQDYAASVGTVPKEELLAARTKPDGSKYTFFTPASRALPEETERAMVNAANVGTIGRQKVLQDFTGSNIALDPTFDSITDYVETVFRQVGQTRVSQKFFERVQQGLVKGSKVLQTGDEYAKLKQSRKTLNELNEIGKSLYHEKAKLTGKTRYAKKDAVAAQKTASNRARSLLKELVGDDDSASVIPYLTNDDLAEILRVAAEPDIRKTPNTQRIYKNFVKKGEYYRRLAEKLEDVKMDIESINSAKGGVRQEIHRLQEDPRTGLQTIVGRDTNGNPFRVEVPPVYAELLQGLNNQQISGAAKVAGTVQKPFREFFTGILNPSFQIAQATYNAVMAPILTKGGWRYFTPDAFSAAVKSLTGTDEFSKQLAANGAIKYGGGLQKLPGDSTASAIASQADVITQAKWLANPARGWERVSSLGGKLDQAARTQSARAVFRRSLDENKSVEKAIADAVYEYNNILPNFSNLSRLVKEVDSFLPYVGAGQAGTRTIMRALKERPVEVGAKLATASLGLTGVVAYNMSQDAGAAFYEDMRSSGKDWVLDNNIVVVTPGASKDEESGEWSGIIKIPLSPELRPVAAAINRSIEGGMDGIPIKQYGLSLFDFVTGQSRQSSSPVAEIATGISTGIDPGTGRQIYDETMSWEDKGRAIKNFVAYKSGVVGRQFADSNERGFLDSLVDRVYGAKGSTSGSRYFKAEEESIKEVGLNQNELAAFKSSVAPRGKDLIGNPIKDKTYYDTADRATTWLRYPKTFEVSRAIDAKKRAQGEPGDPIYDLPPDRLKVVLNTMANYSPGNLEDKAIAQLNPWLKDFNELRSAYFESIIKEPSEYDPMGIKIPKANSSLQTKLDKAKSLSGAEKAQYLNSNDDVTQFYTELNAYQRAKREFLGLPQFDDYPQVSNELQAKMDAYFKLSADERKAWRANNKDSWDAMLVQWQKQDMWNLQQEGGLAVYEGIDITEKGVKAITDLAQALGYSGGSGSGSSPRRGSPQGFTNITNLAGEGSAKKLRNIEAKQVIKRQKANYLPSAKAPRKINIKSLALPSALPTFDSTQGKG